MEQYCFVDSNCLNGQKCHNFSCSNGQNGQSCNYDTDCIASKRCLSVPILGKCFIGGNCDDEGRKDGGFCCRDNDCASNKCNTFHQCGHRKYGEECNEDFDCRDHITCDNGTCGKLNYNTT